MRASSISTAYCDRLRATARYDLVNGPSIPFTGKAVHRAKAIGMLADAVLFGLGGLAGLDRLYKSPVSLENGYYYL